MDSSFAIVLLFYVSLSAAQTLVTIPGLGSLQGRTSTSYFTNRTIYEFRGIPYAERPDRFMPPVKKNSWEGVRSAVSYGRFCPQTVLLNRNNTGDLEDCLFLDIYSPKVSNDSKLPVLFFIHGGSFVTGSSQVVNPGFFLEHDIVIVSIQYRLGALGFLSLGVDEIPGNAGMYDQLMALQFVYDYILYFGGDPERITISGISAGATSAALLYVSPLTQDIIKQGMFFSGSALAVWAVGTSAGEDGLGIAKYAGCEQGDELVSCLQNLEPLQLVKAYNEFLVDQRNKGNSEMRGVNPVVDGKFLNAMPLDILGNSSFKGRPMVTSVGKHEGLNWQSIIYLYYLKSNNLTDDYVTLTFGMPDILLKYTGQKDVSCTIGAAIKDEYFKPSDMGRFTRMRNGITDYIGAAYFKGPARKMAELNSLRGGTSYLTTYDYYMQAWNLGREEIPHGYDQYALFPHTNFAYSEADLVIVRNLTTIYANFLATGTPSGVSWEPYTLESGKYLVINSTMTVRTNFEQEYFVAEKEGLY